MGNSMSRGGYGSRYNRGYGAQPVAAAPRRPFFNMGWRGNQGGMRTAPRRGYGTGAPVRRRRNRFGLHFGRNRGYY
jgi:hypothetical protein